MLTRIELHGVLADKFGRHFEMDISTIKEATYSLGCQLPEFKKYMLESEAEGLQFAVFTDKISLATNVSEDRLDNLTSASVIHVVPKVVGAGGNGGIFQFIAGAVLVGLSFVPFLAPISTYLMSAGIGLMVGGAASLLMPSPDLESQDPDGNKPSNGFGGAVTTVSQGNPVPLLYGERDVGGFIISAFLSHLSGEEDYFESSS